MEGPVKIGLAVAIFSTLLFGGIILVDRSRNAIGEEPLGVNYPDQGRQHISVGAPHPSYNSNPPTSGWHYGKAADWGIYDQPLPDEQLIHNLEHGGVNIFYKPGEVDRQTIEKLKIIQRDFPRKTVLAPRLENNKPLALASWTYLLELDSFDEKLIREFIRRNKNRAPEYFPD
jgi:hypothetical protein